MKTMRILQKDKKTYAIITPVPLGLVTVDFLQKLLEVAKKYEIKTMKFTSATRVILIGLKEEEIDEVWKDLGISPEDAKPTNVRIKVCPGDFCRLGQQDTFELGSELNKRYYGKNFPAKFKIAVSGCVNDCAEACIKDLGFIAKSKGWTVTVGGCGASRPLLAKELVKDVSTEEALKIAEKVAKFYEEKGQKKMRLGHLIEKFGWEEFCKEILG